MDKSHEFADLFSIYEWLMVAVAAIVFGAVAVAIVRSRRAGPPSRRSSHHLAEGLYAAVLAVIAAGLVAATFRTESRTDRLAPDPDYELAATAFQWGWAFSYDGRPQVLGNDVEPPRLLVPRGLRIRVVLRSRDVIHALWVPSLRFKRDAFPDRTTRFDLVFDRPGRFVGRCAEFCGLEHEGMSFYLDVVSPPEFRAWLAGLGRNHRPTP